MVNVVKNPDAVSDLEEIFVYIGLENIDAALRFQVAAEQAFEFLARSPYAGVERHFLGTQLA